MTSLVGMAVRNVVTLQYAFASCTFCRNLYFVKLFFKFERSFTSSRYAIFLLSVAIHNCAWRFKSLHGRFKSSCGASSPRVALQVCVALQVLLSSLRQHRFQSCDAQRTYDSLIDILHLMININNPKVKTSLSFCQTQSKIVKNVRCCKLIGFS